MEDCRHEWVIETAEGPTSWGECRVCHERREFQNATPDITVWGHSKGQHSHKIWKDAEELAERAEENNAELSLVYEAREMELA